MDPVIIEPAGPVTLVAATLASLDAEEVSGDRLAGHLGVAAPPTWPPEHNDASTRDWMRSLLAEHPDEPGYGFWYIVAGGRLVGMCGYKGPPDATGTVEIGYSVIEAEQRKGYGSAATAGLVARAFRDSRVMFVAGEILPPLEASQKVMIRNGFRLVSSRPDDEVGEILRFVRARPT